MRILRRAARRVGDLFGREVLEGYEHEELVDVIFRKTALYEPAGVWPEMAGVERVLDFGGGCGRHYKLAALTAPGIRWAVVETPAMVRRAQALATDRLRFFADIGEAASWLGEVEVMHSDGALHYTPDPEAVLRGLLSVRAGRLLWDRVNLVGGETWAPLRQVSYLTDNGPGAAPADVKEKSVVYTGRLMPEAVFRLLHRREGYILDRHGTGPAPGGEGLLYTFEFHRPASV